MSLKEFSIIERYFKSLSGIAPGVVTGPGDDCAVLAPPPGEQLCVSTDTLLEGVHFPAHCDPEVVAQRTVAANLSDLAAMGASPFACVLALTLPANDDEWLEVFAGRLKSLLDDAGMTLVGGNLTRGGLSLTMTVMGLVPDGKVILRSSAQQGDDIYVTGTPGDAGRGLQLIDAPDDNTYLIGRYENPTPRVTTGVKLRGVATAMIDVSDGLAADIGHLCEESQLGAEIETGLLPLSKALRESAGADAETLALTAGDDYELCFTARPSDSALIQALAQECGHPMTRIGQMTGSTLIVRNQQGESLSDLEGYLHFS